MYSATFVWNVVKILVKSIWSVVSFCHLKIVFPFIFYLADLSIGVSRLLVKVKCIAQLYPALPPHGL